MSRLLTITGLFCRIASLLYGSFAKETYHYRNMIGMQIYACRHWAAAVYRLVGSWQLQISVAEYRLFCTALLQKRPIIIEIWSAYKYMPIDFELQQYNPPWGGYDISYIYRLRYRALLQKRHILLRSLLIAYRVATISRLLEIIGLFCRIASVLWGSFAKETYTFEEPTHRSHPISASAISHYGVASVSRID